ncbi:hypothetical protein DMENIID0001_042380 [Sergentomyia squamirostris]
MKNVEKNIFIKYKTRLEMNLLSSVGFFLVICQFFCAAPVNIDFFSFRSPSRGCFSSFGGFLGFLKVFLHSIWNVIVLGCIVTSTYFQHKEFDQDMDVIQKALYMGEYIFGTINVIIIIVSCQWQRSFYRFHFKRIVDSALRLHRFGFIPKFLEIKLFLRRCVSICGIFFIVVVIIDLFYNQLIPKSFFRSSTVYTIPNVISCLAIIQLAGVLFIQRSMITHINSHLLDLDGISLTAPFSLPFAQEAIDTIDSLRKIHRDLANMAEIVIRNFGILIVTTFTACFLILSIQLFALYQMFENYKSSNIFLLWYTILWIFLHGGKIVLIVYFSASFTKEKMRTGMVLHQMEIRKQFQTDALVTSINKFSMQILHEPKHHSACDIIDLDLTLLNTVSLTEFHQSLVFP